ncbi:4-amino-4-deoxy-L-arabinose transferase-like glycosyltransferase [Streptacidiphilus sp. MAP12-20]|uniref:ArnT family glycosyltransferase n=1 Tax=Streptacidiphilus sp. MAP12-20 TaxID=3156299 RepID=UPI003516E595
MPMFTAPVHPGRPKGSAAIADRLILLGLCALSAVLFAWGIGRSQFHPFYADAVRSMTLSWKGFVFGSFDPGNTITLDKLPGFLWPQAVAARLFGFHPWALTLPQVVEGVVSVGVLHTLVRRWAGRTAGVLAALAFMLTPVVTGLFRTAVEDPAFTLLLLLAAEATSRAAQSGRTRTLLLAATWVGLAFQAKMLEAFAVLPVLAAVYLMSSPTPLRRRCVQLAAAGTLAVLVSASWMALVAVTPSADRPYVDGTTDNSPVSMVVGYNFLNRFSAVGLNAMGTGSVSAVRGGGVSGVDPNSGGRTHTNNAIPQAARSDGWAKLLRGSLASQVGWLYPTALAGFAAGLFARRGRPRTDPVRAGYVLWGSWLAGFFVVLSAGSVAGHAYYLGVIAAPLAALSGAGLPQLWRSYRSGVVESGARVEARSGTIRALALPVTVAATAVWAVVLSRPYQGFRPWVTPTVTLLGGLCVGLLLLPILLRALGVRPRPYLARAGAAAAVAAGLVTTLLAPTAWTSSVFDAHYPHSMMGALGPTALLGPGSGSPAATQTSTPKSSSHNAGATAAFASWARLLDSGGDGPSSLDPGQRALLAYTTAHRGAARYLFATTSWTAAAPFILATGARVLPMGGFTEQVPWPTVRAVRQDVADGRLRYVLISSARMPGATAGTATGRTGDSTPAAGVRSWVTATCHPVSVPALQTSRQDPQRLYDCAPSPTPPATRTSPSRTAGAAARPNP